MNKVKMTKNLSRKQCISQNDQETVSKTKYKSKWPKSQVKNKVEVKMTSNQKIQKTTYKSKWFGNKVKNKVSQNDDKSKSSKNKVQVKITRNTCQKQN